MLPYSYTPSIINIYIYLVMRIVLCLSTGPHPILSAEHGGGPNLKSVSICFIQTLSLSDGTKKPLKKALL